MNKQYDWIEQELSGLAERSLERSLPSVAFREQEAGKWIEIAGKRLLNLSSNNYLGLAGDERISEAASRAVKIGGAGATASRLVVGNYTLYSELEARLAEWKGREKALFYPNGYMANIGAITSLVGRGDAVFSDRFNHASIVDGIILSRAEHYRYQHNDVEHLEYLLKKQENARRKLIVTDAVFSMDGDSAPLLELVRIRNKYNSLLMVDEAHAAGIYGEKGEGLSHSLGIHQEIDILMGTCSKAFGVYGGYICADAVMVRYLLNKSRSLIYTTGLPPAVIASVDAALTIIQNEPERRERLQQNSHLFRSRLTQAGFTSQPGDSPIIPLFVGENDRALAFSAKLREAGIAAVAIRPPTVPAGTARIRFSVMATHTETELNNALDTMIRIGRELEVIA